MFIAVSKAYGDIFKCFVLFTNQRYSVQCHGWLHKIISLPITQSTFMALMAEAAMLVTSHWKERRNLVLLTEARKSTSTNWECACDTKLELNISHLSWVHCKKKCPLVNQINQFQIFMRKCKTLVLYIYNVYPSLSPEIVVQTGILYQTGLLIILNLHATTSAAYMFICSWVTAKYCILL